MRGLVDYGIRHPRTILAATALTAVIALVQFPRIQVDTDPENMLPWDAPVRVFHHATKKEFGLYDYMVLGVVHERHPQGVFNAATLGRIYAITEEIKKIPGVVSHEVIAPSTKDNIEQAGEGSVRFDWLMPQPPQTVEEINHIRAEAQDHPFFKGSVISGDGKALAIYVPIERKDISYRVAQAIRHIVRKSAGDEEYHITGLPVAEDQFGVEMFRQMAVSAPLAGMIIFVLLWIFFKALHLIVAPMILAVVTVLVTMGLLIGLGYPVHIMSSMIPIFLMPIAVLDSVHILSEFFDKYPRFKDRQKTVRLVFGELFTPMLYTSLTSIAGFFSLSFSPIPPLQVFGVFVAIGIALAWVLTMLFIPAYIMLLPEKTFADFGHPHCGEQPHLVDRMLQWMHGVSTQRFKIVLALTGVVTLAAVYGVLHIRVNDNPVRWFTAKHPIRVADRILNKHFAGTYEAYLVLEAEDKKNGAFLEPAMLRYIEGLQTAAARSPDVGKTTSLADIVKKVYGELLGGDRGHYVVPKTKAAAAQCLISFENSHKPDDLWHLTTPDYSKVNIWFQIRKGDNRNMSDVERLVARYIQENPPPVAIRHGWAGLTYINVVWQGNMVVGMLKNFLGSFLIVFFMMLVLFRSPLKALISMIPLTVTILFIYSLLGFFGKDYDMPVAVLSALTLGLSIDFAIHFLQRAIDIHKERKDWRETLREMFGGPGRAIVRNALVIAIGFLPLWAAPLVPYRTVGFFMFMIMLVSGIATLFILPAIVCLMPRAICGVSGKRDEPAKAGAQKEGNL